MELPQIVIKNEGPVTKVFVNGEELKGVQGLEFSHARQHSSRPILKIALLAEQVCLETSQVFALPEVYHPFYVSAEKLVGLGILTDEQLNDLVKKKLL